MSDADKFAYLLTATALCIGFPVGSLMGWGVQWFFCRWLPERKAATRRAPVAGVPERLTSPSNKGNEGR